MGKKQREDFAHAANGYAPRPAAEFDPKVVQRIVSYLLPEGESDSKEIRHKNDNALHRAIQYISCLFRGDQITIEPKGLSDQYINQLSSAEDIRTPLYGRVMRGATFYIKHERTPHASLEFDLYQDVLYLALALDLDHHVSDAKTFFIRLKDKGIPHHPGEKSVSHMCSVCGDIVRFLEDRQSIIAPLVQQNWQNMKQTLFDSSGKRLIGQPCRCFYPLPHR